MISVPVRIPLSAPDISDDDIAAVIAVLRTPQLSLGPKIPAFEKAMAAFVGAKHAVAVNSGTSALHLCIRALDIGDGDEVITTPFSFVASSNCAMFERARPVFADIHPDTLCIDPALVENAITRKTKAIIGVDVFGVPADWKALEAIAKKHKLALIEDSCEAIGSSIGKRKAGTFGDCGTFAFYPNKQMTTGEGGMLITNRDDIALAARMMRNQGRDPESGWLEHEMLGYNYRLSDINAALGLSQIKRLPDMLRMRSQVAGWYSDELAGLEDHLALPAVPKGVDVSWFVYVIRLNDHYGPDHRDTLLSLLRSHRIGCNNYFPSIHLQPFYRKKFGFSEGDFPVTESVSGRTIALPFSTRLTQEQVGRVCVVLRDGLASLSPRHS